MIFDLVIPNAQQPNVGLFFATQPDASLLAVPLHINSASLDEGAEVFDIHRGDKSSVTLIRFHLHKVQDYKQTHCFLTSFQSVRNH